MSKPLTDRIIGYERIYQDVVERFGDDNAFRFFNHHETMVRGNVGRAILFKMIAALLDAKSSRTKGGADLFYAQAIVFSEVAAEVFEIPSLTREQDEDGYIGVDLLRVADDAYMGDFTLSNSSILPLVMQAIDDFKTNGFKQEEADDE